MTGITTAIQTTKTVIPDATAIRQSTPKGLPFAEILGQSIRLNPSISRSALRKTSQSKKTAFNEISIRRAAQ
jgi:hypothetical protein